MSALASEQHGKALAHLLIAFEGNADRAASMLNALLVIGENDEAYIRRIVREEIDAEGVWRGANPEHGTLSEQRMALAEQRDAAISANRREGF